MFKYRYISFILILVMLSAGVFNYISETKPKSSFGRFAFKYGLDLKGGTELTYRADVSKVSSPGVSDAMDTLRDLIERRVNIFGVSEPLVQVENAPGLSGVSEHRLIVELPGVTDVKEAVEIIGKTPSLEFRLMKDGADKILATLAQNATTTNATTTINDLFISTGITGQLLEHAQLEFNSNTQEPTVALTFNNEGKDLFAKVTKENIGKYLGIFLDGALIESPVIREEIPNGRAQISGSFTPERAKSLVRDLNYGALPLPIELVGTKTIGPTLGEAALNAGVNAGVWGFILVAVFLILWYRLPGVIATISLVMYIILSLLVFKLIPVTLSAAGLAGFILSMGMAVDANILIFERMKEELKRNRILSDAMHEGFHRAWLSIRDSNISSIITAIVLFWLGTSAVKGFALTLGLGVIISMFTAITASRTFLFAIENKTVNPLIKFLFGSGKNN